MITKHKGESTKRQRNQAAEELAETTKKPGIFDSHEFIPSFTKLFNELLAKDRIKILKQIPGEIPQQLITVQDFFDELDRRSHSDKDPTYIMNMIDLIPTVCSEQSIKCPEDYMQWEIREISDFRGLIRSLRTGANVSSMAGIHGTIEAVLARVERTLSIEEDDEEEEEDIDYIRSLNWIVSEFVENTDSEYNIALLVSSVKTDLISIIGNIINGALEVRRRGTVRHSVLFVIDEGHEFVMNPNTSGLSREEREVSRVIERLTRLGRKYGLGVCIASQRVAHLNTTAISNCHTTFIGALPRSYDRAQ